MYVLIPASSIVLSKILGSITSNTVNVRTQLIILQLRSKLSNFLSTLTAAY